VLGGLPEFGSGQLTEFAGVQAAIPPQPYLPARFTPAATPTETL